jgi:hypothetical protein
MAKYRHRTFEMFEFQDEAVAALGSKSARVMLATDKPEEWSFCQLTASQLGNVVHIEFKPRPGTDTDAASDVRKDFAYLPECLVNNSQVLIDFKGVQAFGSEEMESLELLNNRLKSKGSRIAICNVDPSLQPSFFPHQSAAGRKS